MIPAVLLIAILLSSGTAHAEKKLSLNEFIEAAERHDIKFKSILNNENQLSFIVDGGLPSRQAVVTLQNEHGIDTKGDNNTSNLSGSISKPFIESGTAVSLSHTANSTPDRKEDVTEFRIEQDLYKNLLGRDVRLKKEALKQEEEIIRIEVKEKYETYLEEIINLYLDYKKSYLDLELAKNALQDALQLRNEVKERLRNRIAFQSDLDRSELQLLLSEDNVQQKTEAFELSWLKIKDITHIPNIMRPMDLKKWDLPPSLVGPLQTATLRNMKVLDLKSSISAKDLTLSQRLDSPSLSLIAGYQMDKSERFSSVVNREEAVIGLQVSVPIGDTSASASVLKAAFAQSEIALQQAIAARNAETQAFELRSILKDVGNRLNISEKKIKLAERILKDDENRYEIGRIDLDRLIDSKQKVLEYQFQNQTNILEYNKAILKWLSWSDGLMESKNLLN